MAEIHAEYNADLLSPAQIELLHAGLESDVQVLADMAGEPDAEAEAEAG
jgi:hypothetical protein